MRQELEKLRNSVKERIEKAQNKEEIERIRIEFLGRRQGRLTRIFKKYGKPYSAPET